MSLECQGHVCMSKSLDQLQGLVWLCCDFKDSFTEVYCMISV